MAAEGKAMTTNNKISTEVVFEVVLSRIYGQSYFGSGGAYGAVFCSENCREVGTRDNGFVSGPDAVEVIDPSKPARFYARGGDDIGEDGRQWGESGVYIPDQGWVQSSAHMLSSKEERRAWRYQ